MNKTMMLFVHPTTKRYLDYGDLLDTEIGIMWSTTGRAEDAFGYEAGKTMADIEARFADQLTEEQRAAVTLAQGEPVTRKIDMNPHGLI